MTTKERPRLDYVAASDATRVTEDEIAWRSGVNAASTGCEEFEYGTGTLDPGGIASITPDNQFDESDCEAAAIVVDGEATVTSDDGEELLGVYDCLFVPPDGEYTFENRSEDPVEFLWGVASPQPSGERHDDESIDHENSPEVIHTLRDLDVSVTLEPGHCSRMWSIAFPETVGSTGLTMGIIKRPPGSVAPLHEHDPSTLTEAFTVIEGRLLITEQNGRENVLEPGDFAYVPEVGAHRNKSIHAEGTTYAFVENPARSREAAPFRFLDSLE